MSAIIAVKPYVRKLDGVCEQAAYFSCFLLSRIARTSASGGFRAK
jgi:hypothetical protein